MSLRPAVHVLFLAGAVLLASPARAAEPEAGAYCPFPAEGELPKCLGPARESYSEFFAGLDDGRITDAEAARVESDVAAGAAAEKRYEALNSLAYGYYRLAQQLARSDAEPDAEAARRLERWNDLLGQSWQASEADPVYRSSLREAVGDIQLRAPRVALRCVDAEGNEAVCDSAEVVLRGMHQTREQMGLRGALERLLSGLFGGDG